ncbi:restriction endonuclease subunit S [Photobacterium damselae]|uniref:restriction endonuclease subunit S n=1 Tax=Photobacterium damselae TaxID=38293 RepID=UPI003D7EA5ED
MTAMSETKKAALSGKYAAYPEYKDSGFEWLGDIPSHWILSDLKQYCSVRGGYAFPSEIFTTAGEPVIRIGDINPDGSISLKNCKYIPSIIAQQNQSYLVQKGELLMAMTGATIGKAGFYTEERPAFVNQRVGLFKVSRATLNYRFLWYILKSSGYQEYIQLTAFGGAQPNISDTGMVAYKTTIPELQEQNQIAAFLDHETAKIDTLIEKQQQLIELLKEKRQAVISHAVTKGLKPNAPMKDSGVEWLGEVPEHWECKKLKHIATMKTEKSNNSENVIALENIESWSGKHIKTNSIFDGDGYSFSKNDILFNKLRPYLAKVFLCKTNGIAIGDLLVFEPHKNLNSKFAFYLMISPDFIKKVDSSTYGSKMPRASVDFIKEMPFLLPPAQEQIDIATFIERVTDKFNQLEIKAKNAIELMQERRTALISAAVTGKIDVRGFTLPSQENEITQEYTAAYEPDLEPAL